MEHNDRASHGRPALPDTSKWNANRRRRSQLIVALFACLCLVGFLAFRQAILQNGEANDTVKNKVGPLFRGWAKPELAIVLSGEQFGYLQPCGCSKPQYGGLTRRWNFLQALKKKGWPVVAVDLGDLAQKSSPLRSLKYQFSMKALSLMSYAGVGLGKKEFDMSLLNALAEYTLNHPEPNVLAANILTKDTEEVIRGLVKPWSIIHDKNKKIPPVGVIGIVGRSVSDKVNDPVVGFAADNGVVLQNALKNLKGKVALAMMLYQGTLADAKIAAKFAAQYRRQNPMLPEVNVILCLSEDSEPPSNPIVTKAAPRTKIINVGHKGRYVGVVGVFRNPAKQPPWTFEYQLVSIGPEFDTPKGQEAAHPLMNLMETYTKAVKDGNYITQYHTVPHKVQMHFPKAKYVGSQRCMGCHWNAFNIWDVQNPKVLAHSHAFQSVVKAEHPSLRQFDGECVRCHVIGFHHPTGYADALRQNNKRMITKLQDVGCESCHGPGSAHVKDTKNLVIRRLMNPWKATPAELDPKTPMKRREGLHTARMLKINLFCQTCHDSDNDVHWDFAKKWPKIVHMTPKKAAPAVAPKQPAVIEKAKPKANAPGEFPLKPLSKDDEAAQPISALVPANVIPAEQFEQRYLTPRPPLQKRDMTFVPLSWLRRGK